MARPNPQIGAVVKGGEDRISTAAVSPARSPWLGLAGYLAMLIGGVALFFLIRALGEGLSAPLPPSDARTVGRPLPGQVNVMLHVTATLAAVIGLGFVLGRAFRYLGQPPVIGEVVAGILLGPSLLGAISPDALHLLIPSPSSDPMGHVPAALNAISQLGVILYMFLVGLELNATRLAGRAHAVVAVSHSSIVSAVPARDGAGPRTLSDLL